MTERLGWIPTFAGMTSNSQQREAELALVGINRRKFGALPLVRAAAEPARRWFGELSGDPLALDLPRIEAAAAWAVELRLMFDRATVTGGESARQAAWRALVAQVSASQDATDLEPFKRLADAIARWEPAVRELALATGMAVTALGTGPDHVPALRDQVPAACRRRCRTLAS